jgi:uncharacterized protein (DUF433 family)
VTTTKPDRILKRSYFDIEDIPMPTVAYNHIEIDDKGVARITGTRHKVHLLAAHKLMSGQTPEQLQEGFPHLSLAQVYAALAYYYDHQAEIDARIKQDADDAERLAKVLPVSEITREELERRRRQRDAS